MVSSLTLAYAAMVIAVGVLMLIVQMKRQGDFKRIEFTQRIIEQNKDVPKTVSKVIPYYMKRTYGFDREGYEIDSKTGDIDREVIEETYFLINFFNTLADGIDRRVYDEDLIRINFEQDIKVFYRHSKSYLRSSGYSAGSDEMFLSIELLLREWENKKTKKKKVTFFG